MLYLYDFGRSAWGRMLHWGRNLWLKLAVLGGVDSSWRFSDKIIFVIKSRLAIAFAGKLTPVLEEKLLEMKFPGSGPYSLGFMKPCESFRIQIHFWSHGREIPLSKYRWFPLQAQSELQTSINVLGNGVNERERSKKARNETSTFNISLVGKIVECLQVLGVYPVLAWWSVLLPCKRKKLKLGKIKSPSQQIFPQSWEKKTLQCQDSYALPKCSEFAWWSEVQWRIRLGQGSLFLSSISYLVLTCDEGWWVAALVCVWHLSFKLI